MTNVSRLLVALSTLLFAPHFTSVASAQGYDQYGNPVGAPAGAYADTQQMQYGYVGPHPEPYDQAQGPCNIQGPHFHPYSPFDQYLFREANGYFYFIGDLGDFGYTGQLWGYQGNHPIPPESGGGFCYIDWQHRHHFPAPPSMPFRYVGGYYSYYGSWDPAYYTYRNQWMGYYNGYYRSSYYGGRYWTARPAPIYRGSYGYGARGVYRPGMTVVAPGGVMISVGRYGDRPGYYNGGYGNGGYYDGGYGNRPSYGGAPPPPRPAYVPAAPYRPSYSPGYAPPPPHAAGYAPAPPRGGGGAPPPPSRQSAPPPPSRPSAPDTRHRH